jgi:hypothetical protein
MGSDGGVTKARNFFAASPACCAFHECYSPRYTGKIGEIRPGVAAAFPIGERKDTEILPVLEFREGRQKQAEVKIPQGLRDWRAS